ncbi:hypothetical protein RRG08_055132 [Elysia crispata]|uniref:Uncharacterized protein n=1 Tax=Elysia crispata TaxID=231223 RepID=A0AAE1AMH7_9GAST|nr:hypothetical protein RRG08_055132 [Elysia crispata]
MSEHDLKAVEKKDSVSGEAGEAREGTYGSKEDEDDVLADQARSTISQAGRSSITNIHSAISHVDEQAPQNMDDIKKAITFSHSITEAVNDIVTPMREMTILSVQKDSDNSILHKASQRVKEEFTENRALSELAKMYDLYKSSLVENSMLEAQCLELQEKVRQYEARHLWDPRVLKVLLIAERYRQEKALVYDEKNEIETELIDMSIEMKHLEDVIKNKNKDFQKCQDELKKAKELEKQVENLEVLIMRKDNMIQALQDSHEIQVSHSNQTTQRKISMFDSSPRCSSNDRELTVKMEQLQSDKAVLKNDLEEKLSMLHNVYRKVARLRQETEELNKQSKKQTTAYDKKELENRRLLTKVSNLEKNLAVIRDQLTVAKSEITGLRKTLEGCVQDNTGVTRALMMKKQEGATYYHHLKAALKRLAEAHQENKLCADKQNLLRKESKVKDQELIKAQRQLSDKKLECGVLTARLYKIEAYKKRQLELIKLTRMNTSQMVKEISGLRNSLVLGRGQFAKVERSMMRMQGQIEALQQEYMSVFEKNVLLVRNYEMSSSVIDQLEQQKISADRRMAHLMKTNIDLYTQTTSQQEIALMQSHQFQLKENEIKGLLSRLEEEDHKAERMICKDKEKMNIIDHLHADVNAKEEKIKSLKSIIESHCQLNKSLNDKVEELIDQLRQIQTQKELVRRQRDLFGTKLLQSQAETQLCQEGLRIAKETITKYSVDFYNMQNDLRTLKLEVKNLRRKIKLSEGHADLIQTLRQELGQTCKALELQKCKNSILEHTKMPQMHRWRSLQASDPSKYEMVMKNQLLIRRVIDKTNEIARLEELLKQKDMLYMSLRVLVQRRMDAQLSSEMQDAKAIIRKQQHQLKAVTAELNMIHDDCCQAKFREQENKKKLDEIVLKQTQEKAAKLRNASKRTESSHIPFLPLLPQISKEKARQ